MVFDLDPDLVASTGEHVSFGCRNLRLADVRNSLNGRSLVAVIWQNGQKKAGIVTDQQAFSELLARHNMFTGGYANGVSFYAIHWQKPEDPPSHPDQFVGLVPYWPASKPKDKHQPEKDPHLILPPEVVSSALPLCI